MSLRHFFESIDGEDGRKRKMTAVIIRKTTKTMTIRNRTATVLMKERGRLKTKRTKTTTSRKRKRASVLVKERGKLTAMLIRNKTNTRTIRNRRW